MTHTAELAACTLRFRCDDALSAQAEGLEKILREIEQERGPRFLSPGKKIQAGWTLLTVVKEDDGGWWLHEPNYNDDPSSGLHNDLTVSLTVIAQQNDIIRMLGVEAEAVSFQEKVIFANGCMDEAEIFLRRSEPDAKDADSGWFIGYASEEVNNSEMSAMYVADLVSIRPALLQMLLLPTGYMAVFNGDDVEAVLNEKNEKVYPEEE